MSAGLDVNLDSPLEVHLQTLVSEENSHHHFPHTGFNRFELYSSIKSKLQNEYYRDIDGALTKDSNNGAFTRHDAGHVDDVIRKAGQLLGANSDDDNPALNRLKPYEVFALLVACLIHDAGNIAGRRGHANRAREILRNVSDGKLDSKEISLISKIARAHGGKTATGNADTIGELLTRDGVDNITVKPRLLAAILRFSDELAENSRRANRRGDQGSSEFPNLFCSTISVSVDYDSRWIALSFAITGTECNLLGQSEEGQEMYFLDYISKRIAKTELERRYCDRYLRGFATYDKIRVDIELLHEDDEWRQAVVFELAEDGYPNSDSLGATLRKELNGEAIAGEYSIFLEGGETP